MKTIEEFQTFYESQIKPDLEPLKIQCQEIKRKAVFRHSFMGLITFALIIFISFLIFIKLKNPDDDIYDYFFGFFYSGIFLIISISFWIFSIRRIVPKDLKKAFKEAVIKKIIQFIDEKLSYSPESKVIDGLDILRKEMYHYEEYYPDLYKAEDFIEGKIGSTSFRFFEITGMEYTKIVDTKYLKKYYMPGIISFKGLFFTALFNKSYKGKTLIVPKFQGRHPGWLLSDFERINLEDMEFESYFSVFGTDQIESRYIISTSLMKRLLDVRKKANRNIRVYFIDNKIEIAIAYSKELFEIDIYKTIYDFTAIMEYYNDLRLGIDIVNDLNLNTRIWNYPGQKKISGKKEERLTQEYIKPRKKIIYILLAIFLGIFGVHSYYARYWEKGRFQLMFTLWSLGVFSPIVLIWAIIDIFSTSEDGLGLPFE